VISNGDDIIEVEMGTTKCLRRMKERRNNKRIEIFIPWHKAYAIRCGLIPIKQTTMRPPLPCIRAPLCRRRQQVYPN
jgi:hypothetical protein